MFAGIGGPIPRIEGKFAGWPHESVSATGLRNMSQADQLQSLAAQVGKRLLARKLFLATAESCTGGWVAEAVTSVAGSSAWFDCGFVTYSDEAKQRLLAVPAELLEADGPGAVSEDAVMAMTAGAIANSRANLAVAISGIAGPDGGTADKPVGTVWIAWQWEQSQMARKFQFSGGRAAVREASVLAALEGLLALLN